MQHFKRLELKIENWKEKAKIRSRENSKLRRDLLRTRKCALRWKAECICHRKELKRLKKSLVPLSAKDKDSRPLRHRYTSLLICLCLCFRLRGNCSLRGCQSILHEFNNRWGLWDVVPSYSSIRNWEQKMGYWQIENRTFEGEDWVLIVDESRSSGGESVLLLLGISSGSYDFTHSLSFEDVEVLSIKVDSSWKGEEIAQVIKSLYAKGLSFSYVVSDGGNNLCKCFRLLELDRIEDCSHALGNILEKAYKDDPQFIEFTKACAGFKQKVVMGKDAPYMPAAQRSKARFLNIFPLVNWANKILKLIDDPTFDKTQKVCQKLEWIQGYRPLIEQLTILTELVNQISKILKNNGLSEVTAQKCREILKTETLPEWFRSQVEQYLKTNLEKVPKGQTYICCSDVIESFFGKFKHQLKTTSLQGITQSCLNIANYPAKFDTDKVKIVMEQVTVRDIYKWRNENLKENINQKRKNLFKNVA